MLVGLLFVLRVFVALTMAVCFEGLRSFLNDNKPYFDLEAGPISEILA